MVKCCCATTSTPALCPVSCCEARWLITRKASRAKTLKREAVFGFALRVYRVDPHPRVTAVAKRTQPPRRLPSPATKRARDLKKEGGCPIAQLSGRGIFKILRAEHDLSSALGGLPKSLFKQVAS